jgi:hypothetical protein
MVDLKLAEIKEKIPLDDNMKYGIKLGFLNKLFSEKLVTEREYNAIKNDIKKLHKIPYVNEEFNTKQRK